jgi:phosphatidylinositol alpha 1,6-mannosyltransferase
VTDTRLPRVALFTDSFHEVNGVALTSRQFEAYARRSDIPFFSCHAGPADREWNDGSVTRFEWKRSGVALGLEADLSFDLLFARHLRRAETALRRFAPDLVHVTSPGDCGLLGAVLAHRLRIPLAASWHTNIHEFGARRLDRLIHWLPETRRRAVVRQVEARSLDLTLLFYRLAKVLFAPNPQLVDLLQSRLHRPCALMSRGIDSETFAPERRRREDSLFRIGYVGRLSVEKNLLEFVALEKALLARGLRHFEIVFVGHGKLTETLRSCLTQARFTGVLTGDALAEAYASFDAFVFPSRTDTFGNVVLEALASGVPAIVTNAGGPSFLVRDGETGFIVRDTAELIDRTCRLMSDPAERLRMGRAARAYAVAHHGWDSVFRSVYSQYGTLGLTAASSRVALRAPVPDC